jgi:hypothetical protein
MPSKSILFDNLNDMKKLKNHDNDFS